MKISRAAEEYADTLCFNESREIVEAAHKELRRASFDDSEQLDYDARLRAAAAMVSARVRSYVVAYEKEGLSIDHDDLLEILQKVRELIRRQAGQLFSKGLGTITMIRNQWTDSYRTRMQEHFENKALQLAEPAMNELNLKVKEMDLNRARRASMENYYKVLKWIYDRADGQRHHPVDLRKLLEAADGLPLKEIQKASDWLEGEGLITQENDDGTLVQLCHPGIKEIEASVREPNKGTEHFSPTIIQHFHAAVGAVQTGESSVANIQQNFGTDAEGVLRLLDELKDHIRPENRTDAMEYIAELENEVKTGAPNQTRMKAFLKGLGAFAQKTGESIVIELTKQLIDGKLS